MDTTPEDVLSTPIETLPGTSGLTIKRLKNIGISTYLDLLNYFPFRYDNFSLISQIGNAQPGETVSIKGKIIKIKQEIIRSRLKLQKAILTDGTGEIELVWYNQPYLLRLLTTDAYISAAGEIKQFHNKKVMETSQYEILKTPDQITIHSGRLVPVYSEKYGLSSKTIREKMFFIQNFALKNNDIDLEWLPKEIQLYNKLIDETQAYKQIHFPDNQTDAEQARYRLSFDELFTIQLSGALVREEWKKETVSIPLHLTKGINNKVNSLIASLPFTLTASQTKVIQEILQDIQKTTPMNRFVQGDVGSGKTVVAAIAAYVAFLNGYQTLFMAPTEILAQQHFATLTRLFDAHKIKIALQTGSTKTVTKKKDDHFDIIVGTHALITKTVNFQKVGLVIIDEQHRFGVAQRAQLKQKGINPHLLTMTATPIPRTVSLTLYGELDLSIINEMPKGRLPIKTYLVPHSKRQSAYDWIKKHIRDTAIQVYIICPLIEESEMETMLSVRAATKEYDYLKNDIFKEFKVALLHGKMKSKEKEQIMLDFKNKKFDILVSTSVVEVGVDVPNATIMVIEGAERFGLAQLHQLRGRVGRGDKQSYCLLFTSSADMQNTKRLEFFSKNTSGMLLAEYDLRKRGPGQVYGLRQHGYDNLKIAQFSDLDLIHSTKNAVTYFLNHYSVDDYPEIQKRIEQHQIEEVSRD